MKMLEKVVHFLGLACLLFATNYVMNHMFEEPSPQPDFKQSIYADLERMNPGKTFPDYSFMKQPSPFPKLPPPTMQETLEEQVRMRLQAVR